MSRLPVCSGADAVRAFRQIGYEEEHKDEIERKWRDHFGREA